MWQELNFVGANDFVEELMAKAKELNFVGVKNIVQEVMLFEQEIIKARVKRANSPYNSLSEAK